jgi:MscS family membrane protein
MVGRAALKAKVSPLVRQYLLAALSLVLLILCVAAVSVAQTSPALADAPPEQVGPVIIPTDPPADVLGRMTPRGTINGFLSAVAQENYQQAARFLDLSGLPRGQQARGPEIARDLERLLDRLGWTLPTGAVSDDPTGERRDDFAEDTDVVAYLQADAGNIPVTVRRALGPDGNRIWLISPDFVRQIPLLTQDLTEAPIGYVMVGGLESYRVLGAGIGHWIAVLLLYLVFFFISGFAIRGAIYLTRRIFRWQRPTSEDEKAFLDKLEMPLRVFSTVWLAGGVAFLLGISIIVRQVTMPIGITVGWIAAAVFLWHLSDVLVSALERRMAGRERFDMTAILGFARRMLKFLFVVLIAILVLDSYGVNVTAGLAALGIGGIALALGAQKTLENFIGSLSIIADRPMRVGDFCRIGDVSGTVVDIGMRSTRLRTNEQTLVTIPNGLLSTQMIENFARRGRFLLSRRLIIRIDATSDQLRDFVARLTAVVAAQEKIVHEPPNVRLLGFSEAGYQVEVWAFVDTADFTEFLKVQSALTYGAIAAAQESGVSFSVPLPR